MDVFAPPSTIGERLIMVVDDDPAVRRALKFSLETEGYTVETFDSAEALLADAWPARAACFLLDYHLPGRDGLALIEALRGRSVTSPAILMTSHPDARLRRRAAADHVRIVEKPLIGENLASELSQLVLSRSAADPE